jgi:hypothetical protein
MILGSDYDWYDDYTEARICANNDGLDYPVRFRIGKIQNQPAVIITACPWVPSSVVARVYSAVARGFPQDVHGPHLRRLNLFNFVRHRTWFGKSETWAETMAAWNKAVTEKQVQPGTKYAHVSNFCRDFYQTAKALGQRKYFSRRRHRSPTRQRRRA